jgi:hypothetical protein
MVMGGMLASIGIEKGKPFAPKGKVKKALEQAAEDGYAYLGYMFETPGYSMERYWPDRQWMGILEPSKEGFVFDEGDYLLLDERGSLYHWVTFVPRRLGKASAYLAVLRDADGELLSGKSTYRLRVPAEVPALLLVSYRLQQEDEGIHLQQIWEGRPLILQQVENGIERRRQRRHLLLRDRSERTGGELDSHRRRGFLPPVPVLWSGAGVL